MAIIELRYSPQDSAWFTTNATLVLKAGEPAYHSTTGQFKLGDGTTQLSALPFLPATGGGGSGNFVPYTGATGNVNLNTNSLLMDNGVTDTEMSPAYFGVQINGGSKFGLLEYDKISINDSTISKTMTINASGIVFADSTIQTTAAVSSIGVPYTGATGDVNLGEYQLRAGQIELDQSPTGTAGVAITRWNNTLGSTETTLKGGSVVLKNGVDLVARVVNKVNPNTTLTKAAYQVVKVTGAQGQRLAVNLAQANNDNNSADTLGIVTETIATNQEGFIICVGQIENINTTGSLQGESWADGDVLYLSPTTPGAITKVKPTGATGHIVVLGYVEYAHQNNGKIYVKIMNGWELDELHNVYINNPANNEILTYETSTSLWKNKTVTTALGFTPYNNTNPSGFITSSALTPYLTSSNAALTYYTLTNPSGFITSSALSPYLTTSNAALTYVPYTGATGAVDLATNNLTCGDAIIKKPKITVELVNALTVDFYNRYAMSIDSITNVLNSPTITIQDDNVAYTLGATIAIGSKITITASTASVVVLNATRI